MSQSALYPGSFDPVTYGHIDLLKRAAKVFNPVLVGVAHNTAKETLFSDEERVEMLREVTADIDNIKVVAFRGLVVEFARQQNVHVLIRGLRMISDFEYELQMALTNRRLDSGIETVFLMPSEDCSFLSSGLIKEAARLGADLTSFVPDSIARRLRKKFS